MVYVRRRRSGRLAVLACSLTASMLIPIPVTAELASACEPSAGALYLANFWGPGDVGSQFYAAPESVGYATATIRPWPGDCRGEDTQGTYETTEGTAVDPEDYGHTSGLTPRMCQDIHDGFCVYPAQYQPSIAIVDDADSEVAVESFLFRLTWGEDGLAGPPLPTSAPVHVIDNEGTDRFSLEPIVTGSTAVAYSRSESFSSIRIPVFRAGPAVGTTSVTYTFGAPSDTATLAVDYSDASMTPGTLTFGAGERVGAVPISIENDGQIEGSETFQVALTGTQAVDPKTTTVTILDNDSDPTPPKSWFHHPRHGKTYPYGDYRLREMHVFFSDEGGSEVVRVQMALRKKRLNGSCAWWAKGRWVAGSCSTKRWLAMEFDFDLYLRRFPRLSPSVGTRIKNYTAWCRAEDGAGNLQTTFLHDRQGTRAKGDGNWSTFEVKRA
jgi:hypothetical protein